MLVCTDLISMSEPAPPIGWPCFVLGVVAWKIEGIYMYNHQAAMQGLSPMHWQVAGFKLAHILPLPISCQNSSPAEMFILLSKCVFVLFVPTEVLYSIKSVIFGAAPWEEKAECSYGGFRCFAAPRCTSSLSASLLSYRHVAAHLLINTRPALKVNRHVWIHSRAAKHVLFTKDGVKCT